MKNSRVARRYAQALMMAADSAHIIDKTAEDLEFIRDTFVESRELRRFIDSPIISEQKKKAILRDLFQSRVGSSTLSFLDLLTEKQRERAILDVIEQYLELRDIREGIINVAVSSAIEISAEQERALSERLEQYTNKKVRIRITVDKSLKGGLIVKIGDTVLDASIKRQLELMREQFVHGHALN